MNSALVKRALQKASKALVIPALSVAAITIGCSSADGSSSGGGDTQSASLASTTSIALKTFNFSPKQIEVRSGTKVTWNNEDEILHTVTAGIPGQLSGLFDGKLDGKGSSFNFTFQSPGKVEFFCTIHQSMRGEVTVKP